MVTCFKCGHAFPAPVQISGNVKISGNVRMGGSCPKCGTPFSLPLG
ncbi:MAG TPA: hypothetical protein VGR54_07145 [Nitrosopumilaceae archaeon]|nr:hypothetical protein [Nitrosopumilaceae archaeon]